MRECYKCLNARIEKTTQNSKLIIHNSEKNTCPFERKQLNNDLMLQ